MWLIVAATGIYLTAEPPSTEASFLVINGALSEHRNTTIAATSKRPPIRFIAAEYSKASTIFGCPLNYFSIHRVTNTNATTGHQPKFFLASA
tara:strand:+ start:243 stop:518 length:276 start_codon:yes stop_codon:yes gene_type:complete